MAAKVEADIFSNSDVELKATINDMALLDLQEERQERNTGCVSYTHSLYTCCFKILSCYSNRVIQHYTSNPLSAYTGRIDKPIFSVEYVLQNQEHFGMFCIAHHFIAFLVFHFSLSFAQD